MTAALDRIVIRAGAEPGAPRGPWALLAREFPTVAVERNPDGALGRPADLTVEHWESPAFDFWAFDRRFDRVVAERRPLIIAGSPACPAAVPAAALAILTRAQRLVGRRNRASESLFFGGLLARHRDLHDLSLPLVRADYDHALDVWQWTLRLAPDASLALQLAALFHDLERLRSEARERQEHRPGGAGDHQAYQQRYAREGARFAAGVLAAAGVHPAVVERAGRLIACHGEPVSGRDPELTHLVDADALSFFSLGSPGFLDAYGPAHTRQKAVFTLARLSLDGRSRLAQLRLRPAILRLIDELLPGIPLPAAGPPPERAPMAARSAPRPLIAR